MKICSRCRVSKPLSGFYTIKRGENAGKFIPACRACSKNNCNSYAEQNRERVNARQRVYNANNKTAVRLSKIKATYGLSKEAYESMPKVCAICGTGGKVCIDHSHQSGQVRGMLCALCNKGLGQFRDNPQFLLRAADYLLATPTVNAIARKKNRRIA